MKPKELIYRYLSGQANVEETAELNSLLEQDKELRRTLIREAGIDAGLREIALEELSAAEGDGNGNIVQLSLPKLLWSVGIAAAVTILAGISFMHFSKPRIIARLVSVENASWESSLPTLPGSDLTAGRLKLTTGIATIRFHSGAELTMEAPADLILETPMRGKLLAGSAVVDVPKPAIGFIIDTPNGYAVDHGTKFAVTVSQSSKKSNFEVLKGEISVHIPSSGKEVYLKTEQSASASAGELTSYLEQLPEKEINKGPETIRINTKGRTTSVVRNNYRAKQLHPDFLMVRHIATEKPQERRALMSFKIDKVDFTKVKKAKLWLNQVPCGIGFATRLPVTNRFSIYGVTEESQELFDKKLKWEEAPQPEDCVLLGTFEIPRSRQTGQYGIEGDALLNFLKADGNGFVTMLLIRESAEISGKGTGLVHAFATDSHPEASGPFLKLVMKETP
ncbi:FecR domain-containing protein [Luteolibacter algae]|uniref:FecR domain-containing protein n=1 Tax=Luteolibacter algae TaxID=454151 RepID=A0ABW5D8X2_9BACT